MYRLLAVFAHPDDETFGVGGTLAKYAAQDTHVTLICATRGEVGEIAPGTGATPETLGQVREGELRCAAQTLGVRNLIFLDYRDSGMAGTPGRHCSVIKPNLVPTIPFAACPKASCAK
jgi:LmbE family N-acetylglucosaminyl deacetylase